MIGAGVSALFQFHKGTIKTGGRPRVRALRTISIP